MNAAQFLLLAYVVLIPVVAVALYRVGWLRDPEDAAYVGTIWPALVASFVLGFLYVALAWIVRVVCNRRPAP